MSGGSNKASKGGTGYKGNAGAKSGATQGSMKGKTSTPSRISFSSLKSPIGTPKTVGKPSYGRGVPYGGMSILGIDRGPSKIGQKTYTGTPSVKFSNLSMSASNKDQSRLPQTSAPKNQARIQTHMTVPGGYGIAAYEGGPGKKPKDQARITPSSIPRAMVNNYGAYRSPPGSGIAKPDPTGIAARTVFPGSNAPRDRVISTELAFGPQSTMPQRPVSRTPQRPMVANAMPRRPVSPSPQRIAESAFGLPQQAQFNPPQRPYSPTPQRPQVAAAMPQRPYSTTPQQPNYSGPPVGSVQSPSSAASSFYEADFPTPSLPQKAYNKYVGNPLASIQRNLNKADQFIGGLGFGGNGFNGGNPNAPLGDNHYFPASGQGGDIYSSTSGGAAQSGAQAPATPDANAPGNLKYQAPPWAYPYYSQQWAFPPNFRFGK
jgi:hypothetical protein